ncbi:MFS general substrate transporter [Lentithecium fluviatile CBS 122367]|uniref:MFS general substrate transporter n=1 Tax=Lentithecium fluviatile CBS 122367 TaxID=1168545 RepID=A0A6G1IE02_9PLEO|nr:MFS general substrate transporter [Lentithecium fluviatile CBS 122367]
MPFLGRIPLYHKASSSGTSTLRHPTLCSCETDWQSLDTGTIGPVTSVKAFQDSFGTMRATKHGTVVPAILLPVTFTGLFAGNLADVYGRGTAIILISPTQRRSPLVSIASFLLVFGLAFGYFMSYGTARMLVTSMSWRIPLIFHVLMSFSFAAACSKLPPSPRWLQLKGRNEEAQLEEMASESNDIPIQRGFAASVRATNQHYAKVFQSGSRSCAALACFLMAFQQFSGIDGLLFYAPLLFQRAGLASEQASFLASGVSALAMLAVTIPASIYCDRWGRRTSTIVGGVLSTAMMPLIGISFRIYASEIQPSSTRVGATSLAQSSNWFASWIVAFMTPILLARSSFGAYFFFGFSSLFCLIICLYIMAETRSESLEAIDQAFRQISSGFALGKLRRRNVAVANEEGIAPEVGHHPPARVQSIL